LMTMMIMMMTMTMTQSAHILFNYINTSDTTIDITQGLY
jgi:hypothetical protein